MGEDAIAGIYSQLPDYSEKTTRYQIHHLRRKGYNVPSCATVMSYGLCCAVCRVGNPIRWHRLDNRRKKEILK
jgi:DNA primase large subunit